MKTGSIPSGRPAVLPSPMSLAPWRDLAELSKPDVRLVGRSAELKAKRRMPPVAAAASALCWRFGGWSRRVQGAAVLPPRGFGPVATCHLLW
jgi:hypothetical protein